MIFILKTLLDQYASSCLIVFILTRHIGMNNDIKMTANVVTVSPV